MENDQSQATLDEILHDEHHRMTAKDAKLLQLLDPNYSCSSRLIDFYIRLKGAYDETQINPLNSMHDKRRETINNLGKEAEKLFRKCFRGPTFDIRKKLKEVDRMKEAAFDELIMAGHDVEEADDQRLYELARKFDFANPELKVKKLARLAVRNSMESQLQQPSSSIFSLRPRQEPCDKKLIEYLRHLCAKILFPLRKVLDLYNLARSVEPDVLTDVPIKFEKFNEYNRICLTLQKEDTRESTETAIQEAIKRATENRFLASLRLEKR